MEGLFVLVIVFGGVLVIPFVLGMWFRGVTYGRHEYQIEEAWYNKFEAQRHQYDRDREMWRSRLQELIVKPPASVPQEEWAKWAHDLWKDGLLEAP